MPAAIEAKLLRPISSLQRFPEPFCNELCSLYLQPPKVPRTFGASTKSKLKDYNLLQGLIQLR
ncbi:hypothetical protein EI989_02995 [Streptococcus suis]|nr:hypothetical protein EI985_03115 [Streptococcus suis]RRR41501.1 hypothetical protein EI989_02995 [Streptococcus suis]RRR63826.1 hypothetical protein EI991_02830 [Streptococcus suis]